MCRFVLYQGVPLTIASLVTEPAHSIINQSVHSRESEEPLNGDGFGVAWYAPELSHKPAYITQGERGAGFAEVARVILATR